MRLITSSVWLVGVVQAGAFVTAAFSLATIPNHLHRLLELFSHFRVQYLIVAVLCSVLFVVLRKWSWLLLMLAIAGINALYVIPWYFGPEAKPPPGATTISVLLANVEGHENDPDRFIEWLGDEQPDIVFLQEVEDRWVGALAALKDSYPYQYAVPRTDKFGIAVLGREPLASVRQHDGPPEGFPTLVVTAAIAGQPVTFISSHPMPPIGGRAIDSRNRQLADIAELVTSLEPPIVLIGDLNTSMWSHHYKMLIAATGLRDAREGFGVVPSWPTYLPFAMIPIDHCLVSAGVVVLDVDTGPRIGADHLPLAVTLSLQ